MNYGTWPSVRTVSPVPAGRGDLPPAGVRVLTVATYYHVIRAGCVGRRRPNGTHADSTALCGVTGQESPMPATAVSRRSWCGTCVQAYAAEGYDSADHGGRLFL